MSPDDETAAELRKFNAYKSKWSGLKCLEIQELMNLSKQYPFTSFISNYTILNAGARLLCAGPKFDDKQTELLTAYLQQMQTISTTTQICLPKQFDVCLNLDRIWDFSYVLRGEDFWEPLRLDAVKPKLLVENLKLKLNLYFSLLYLNIYSQKRCNKTEFS